MAELNTLGAPVKAALESLADGARLGMAYVQGLIPELDALRNRVYQLTVFATPAALLSDPTIYGSTRVPGNYMTAGQFRYRIEASDSLNYHLTTVGNVRLRFDDTGLTTIPFDAFAPAKNGYAPTFMEGAPDEASITDDIPKLNAALVLAAGRRVLMSPGVYGQNSTLVLPDGCHLDGGQFDVTIAAKSAFTGWQCETANYQAAYDNAQSDVNGDFHALVPKDLKVTGIIFDGNHQSYYRSFYRRTSGHGVRLYCLQPSLDIRVFNSPGIGVHSYARGGNGPTPLRPGRTKQANIRLLIDQTGEEGLIWRGPADVVIDSLYQCNAGARLVGQTTGREDTGKKSSPTYGATNGGQTDGIVFDGVGAEIKFLHSWGNRAGAGVTQYGGRVLGTLFVVENNHFGGIQFLGGTGVLAVLKAHKNGGWVIDFINAPGVYHESSNVYHNSGQTGTETNSHVIGCIQIEDNNSSGTLRAGVVHGIRLGPNSRHFICPSAHVSKQGVLPGHGCKIDAGAAYFNITGVRVHGALGDTGAGVLSAGIHREGGGMGVIQAQTVGCAVGYRNAGPVTNLFIEHVEVLVSTNTGQLVFDGIARANPGQMWRIFGRVGTTDVSVSGGQDAT